MSNHCAVLGLQDPPRIPVLFSSVFYPATLDTLSLAESIFFLYFPQSRGAVKTSLKMDSWEYRRRQGHQSVIEYSRLRRSRKFLEKFKIMFFSNARKLKLILFHQESRTLENHNIAP
jgi:hypothetical protein